MHKIEAEVILYDNVEELEFCTEHPYWRAGEYSKLSFPKLFKFITWDNPCPYVIKELLEVNHEQ